MEGLSAATVQKSSFSLQATSLQFSYSAKGEQDNAVLASLSFDSETAQVSSLTRIDGFHLAGDKILEKIKQVLAERQKGGAPVDAKEAKGAENSDSSEKAADHIVKGVQALFRAYEKQNPDLEPEKLVSSFFEKVRTGVQQGYDDAYKSLKDIGAFDVSGVEDGVKKTRELLDSKLNKFEQFLKEKLGISSVESNVAEDTRTALLDVANTQLAAASPPEGQATSLSVTA